MSSPYDCPLFRGLLCSEGGLPYVDNVLLHVVIVPLIFRI